MNPKPSGLADVVIDGATWMAETIRQELDGAPSACDVQSNPEARGWAANVAKICVPGVILGRGFLAKVVPNASARRWMGCASAWPHWTSRVRMRRRAWMQHFRKTTCLLP